MRKLQAFTSALLLATSPSMLVYPQNPLPQAIAQIVDHAQNSIERDYFLSYDDILNLVEAIESGELEKKCNDEELEQIIQFVAFLAKEGQLPDNSEESLSLDDDIEALLNGDDSIYEDSFSFATPGEYQYMFIPALLNKHGEVVLCKSWLKKQWKHVKHFVKKHKKELIVGAVVVVAATVVVVATVATAGAGTALASSAAASVVGAVAAAESTSAETSPSVPTDVPSLANQETPALKSTVDNQISSFKDSIVQNQFFQPTSTEGLSWKENARTLGSLFAHDSFNSLQHQLAYHPELVQEVNDINSKYTFPIPAASDGVGHPEIDRKFSTDYSYLFSNPSQEVDFNSLAYQARGEKALALGYYTQAVQDFGKAIETNPTNPIPYLERGVAHFGLGEYDHSLEDYKQFTSQVPTNPLSVSEFSMGFAKGLPKGIYESGEGILLFLAEFATHPIHTTEQMVDSITKLVGLMHNEEWGLIAETLSPEMHQLVTEWDNLASDQKGELAGYALGKHGTDILAPGGLAKLASKSIKSAQELIAVCKNIQIAQETLVLEAAAGIGESVKIAEVIEQGQRVTRIADELGFTTSEVGQLKQAGQLEAAVANKYEHLNLSMQESIKLFEEARKKLKPYQGIYMPESQIRELIQETGIPTFARPKGIPENYRVKLANTGGGMKYVHPNNEQTYIRIMPGKPHSPYPYQQKPYVVQMKDGKTLDKSGNIILRDSPQARIPIEEFIYLGD